MNRADIVQLCYQQALSSDPALVLIWGPTGSGKTRLLKALADLLREQLGPALLFCSAHHLVENFFDSMKTFRHQSFQSTIEGRRTLLIDNIWTLSKRPHTAKEFFTSFGRCIARGSSVFIASDLTPTPLAPWSGNIGEWIGESRIFGVTAENANFKDLTPKIGRAHV